MIVIENIDLLETDRDWIEYVRRERVDLNYLPSSELVANKEYYQREIVKGQRFRHPESGEMIIGVTGQAAKIIGVMYEVYENMKFDHKYHLKLQAWVKLPVRTKLFLLIFNSAKYEKLRP